MTLSLNKAVSEIYLAMDRSDPTVFYGQDGVATTFGDALCFTYSDGVLFMDPQKPEHKQYKMICLTAYVTYFSLVIALCENPHMFDGTGIDPKTLSVKEVSMS
jgi:hypothetical protein